MMTFIMIVNGLVQVRDIFKTQRFTGMKRAKVEDCSKVNFFLKSISYFIFYEQLERRKIL